jgi:hypothetical protein
LTPTFPCSNNRNWTESYAWEKPALDEPASGTSLYMGQTYNQPSPRVVDPDITGQAFSVTFYMCGDYWSILDPLPENMSSPPIIKYKLHRTLWGSFNSRNRPIRSLPPYRQLPMIAVQQNPPLPSWSFGTFTMSTALHLLLGGRTPHSLPAHYLTRDHTMDPHRALSFWSGLYRTAPWPLVH